MPAVIATLGYTAWPPKLSFWNLGGRLHGPVTSSISHDDKTSTTWIKSRSAASRSSSQFHLVHGCNGLWAHRWLKMVKRFMGKQLPRWSCVIRVPQWSLLKAKLFKRVFTFTPLRLQWVGTCQFQRYPWGTFPIISGQFLFSDINLFSNHTILVTFNLALNMLFWPQWKFFKSLCSAFCT